MVSNNCKPNGILQKCIAAGQPLTNGLAERNVHKLKSLLLAASDDPAMVEEKIRQNLMRYRATPLGCGRSPAELYLNRKLRIRQDAIFPSKLKPTQPIPEAIPSIRSMPERGCRLGSSSTIGGSSGLGSSSRSTAS
ncbi:unnamed protein product, partial [Nesidiocoris tenuis]